MMKVGYLVERGATLEFLIRNVLRTLINNDLTGGVISAGKDVGQMVQMGQALIKAYIAAGDTSVGTAEQLEALAGAFRTVPDMMKKRSQVIHGIQMRTVDGGLHFGRSQHWNPLLTVTGGVDPQYLDDLIDLAETVIRNVSKAANNCTASPS